MDFREAEFFKVIFEAVGNAVIYLIPMFAFLLIAGVVVSFVFPIIKRKSYKDKK